MSNQLYWIDFTINIVQLTRRNLNVYIQYTYTYMYRDNSKVS